MVDTTKLGEQLAKFNPGGFAKIPSINDVPPPTPHGSVFAAVFEQEHTIYNVIHRLGNPMPRGEATPNFNPIAYIPPQYYDYADRFAGLVNEQQVEWVTDQLAQELRNKAIIAGKPWKAFFSGVAVGLIDLPGYILPGGAIYSNATKGLNIARSAMSVAGANAMATALSEGVLYKTQYARTVDESVMNTFSSALIGAAIGGAASALLPRKIAKDAVRETSDIMANGRPTNYQLEFKPDGTVTTRTQEAPPIKPTGGRPSADVSIASQELQVATGAMQDIPVTPQVKNEALFNAAQNQILDTEYLKESRSLANIPDIIQKAHKVTPYMRLKQSEFGISRAIIDELIESPLGTISTDIELNAMPRNLETRIKRAYATSAYHLLEYQDIFFQQRGLDKGILLRTGQYLEAVIKGRELPGLPWDEFNYQVTQEIRYPNINADPHVQKAARLLETKILDPLKQKAIDLELLPPNVVPSTARGYLMRLWNRAAIIENRSNWEALLYEYYDAVNEALKITLPRVKLYQEAIARAEKLLNKVSADERAKLELGITVLKSEIEAMKYQKIKGQAAAHLLDSDGNWRAIKTNDELRANVTQTTMNILSLGDERLANPLLEGFVAGKPKPLKSRDLLMPDEMATPFLINDAQTVVESYLKSMTPVLEMTSFARERGFLTFGESRATMKQLLRDEWEAKSKGATGDRAVKLKKQLDSDLRDIDATFDLLSGVYGSVPDKDNAFYKIAEGFLQYNQVRLMGSMTLSALPDIGLIAMRYGPYSLIHESIIPLLTSKELRQLTKDDLQVLGFVINTQIGLRMKSYADTANLVVSRGRFGRFKDTVMQGFGNVVLFNQWNDMAQEIAGASAYNFYFKTINLYMQTGKISQLDMRRLTRAGISKEDFGYIHAQWKKHGGTMNGAYYGNMGQWEINTPKDAEIFERLQEAIIKEVRATVVEPTLADKPLFTHSMIGKVATQFKSFGYASTNKVFMSGIQNLDDQNTIAGLMTLLSLGALGYVATSLSRGNEPDLSFAKLSKEAVDRSGILGIFAEYYNIANKVGVVPGMGVSRYKSRGVWGAFFGPTVGAVEDIAAFLNKVANANGEKPLTTKDVDALLRLMPYQNLFYAHQLTRAVARKTAVALGAVDVPDKDRSN